MKRFMKNKVVFSLTILFLVACIAFGINMSYGAYIRRSYIKAVIATNETEKLFGSNLLYGVKNQPENADLDNWISVYPYTVGDPNQAEIKVPIRIYNYLAEDQDRVNQLDVSYKISFKISGSPTMVDGELSGYSVNGYPITQKDTAYYLCLDGLKTEGVQAAKFTLPGRLPNTNEYTVKIPGQDLGKVSVVVKAARVSNDEGSNVFGTDLLYLAARIAPNLASTVQTATVTGNFLYNEGEKPEDYAAYNYNISLTGAPSVVILEWNPDLLEIDPFFENKYGVKPGNGSVVFSMDPGITKVQFYRKREMTGITWENLGVTVSSR